MLITPPAPVAATPIKQVHVAWDVYGDLRGDKNVVAREDGLYKITLDGVEKLTSHDAVQGGTALFALASRLNESLAAQGTTAHPLPDRIADPRTGGQHVVTPNTFRITLDRAGAKNDQTLEGLLGNQPSPIAELLNAARLVNDGQNY